MNKDAVAEVSQQYQAEPAQKQVPKGWYKTKISDIVEDGKISSGLFKSKSSYGAGTAIIKLGDVFANDIFNPFSVQRVEASDSDIKRYSVKVGDLIIALASVKLEGVGKVLFIPTLQEKTIFDHNVALVRLKKEVSSTLMSYVFKADYIRSAVASRATQVGTTFLKSSTILDFTVLLPKSKEEQTAIANALSDTDALLSELEKLIAKKQAIKTAAMQQLLTGRTRLPQFAHHPDGSKKGYKQSELGEIPEDWEVGTYGEIFNFLTTSTNSRSDLSIHAEYGYIHYGDIHTLWNNFLDLNKTNTPKIDPLLVRSAFVQDGDLVMADASEDYEGIGKSIEIKNIGNKSIVAGLHTYLLRDSYSFFVDGFRGYLHQVPAVKSMIDKLATGMKVYGISKRNLEGIYLPIPSKKEQTAIATILSDMDEEIQALEQRLNKTRQIKQGMMQELLTGKTRLVVPQD